MEYLLPLAAFLLGGVLVWLLLRSRIELAFNRGRAELQTEIAALTERLQGREEQITALQTSLSAASREIANLRDSLKDESQKDRLRKRKTIASGSWKRRSGDEKKRSATCMGRTPL